MFLRQITTPGLAVHTYIIADSTVKQAVVIDPVRDIEPLIGILTQEGFEVSYVLETHVHADFISGAKELQQFLGHGCVIGCSSLGGPEWIPHYAQKLIQDHDVIRIGSIRLVARHTPGHTPEHLMWVVYDERRHPKIPTALLTGDLILVGSVGRPDLLGEPAKQRLAHQLYQSLFEQLPQLPDYVELFPAHGAGSLCGKNIQARASSTLGYERLTNPTLTATNEKTWIQNLLQDQAPIPDYFQRMKQMNRQGPPLLSELQPPAHLSLAELAALNPQDVLICDVRMPEEFAAKHLPGSVNIPLRLPSFVNWAAQVIPAGVPLYVILKDQGTLKAVLNAFYLVGLDHAHGYAILEDSFQGTYQTFPILAPQSVAQSLKEGCILDVRSEAERKSHGYVEHSLAIELGVLQKHLDELPRDTCIATLCRSGFRASIAASLLRRAGFKQVVNIEGGIEEWAQARLPLIPGSN
jgi:hydroxyacylglutathione hydrolase